jgi:putative hydrolase of the HAD superfamily
MRPTIAAILLDAAGTLIEPAEPVAETYAKFAREFGADIAPAQLLIAFREVFKKMPPMAFSEFNRDSLDALERGWWRSLVQQVIDRTGGKVRDFDTFFDKLYAHYATGTAWALYPEVLDVLSNLVTRGYPVAVVSNFDSRLPPILRDHGLDPLFTEIVFSTAVGCAKPDPGIFRHALEKLGVTPERAVHVGDSEKADYAGANAAGVEGLLLKRSQEPEIESQDHVIGDLGQLLPWLEARG